jgi:multimeric flavodoxin WrbA
MQNNSDTYILIIWDSMTGGSKALAQSAADGAQSDPDCQIRVKLLQADDVNHDDILRTSGYIFAFPERLAAISGPMKSFFDRCYYPCLGHIEARPYAMMICAGSDGENALRQGMRICQGWRLKPIDDNFIICTHAQTQEEIMAEKIISADDLRKCHDRGAAMAAGLDMGLF